MSWTPRAHSATVLMLGLLALGITACREQEGRPAREARVRGLVSRVEELGEERDLEAIRQLVSERYADGRGNNRQSLMLFLNYYLSANRSIYLLTRVPEVRFADSTHANVLVFVAMAGRPISADRLNALDADLYHVFASVVEEDEGWKIASARWARGWEAELPDTAD